MFIFFNWSGIMMLLASGAALAVVEQVAPYSRWPLLAFGIACIVVDGIARLNGDAPRRIIAPKAGGHLGFIPVWVIGVGFLVTGSVYERDQREPLYVSDMQALRKGPMSEDAKQLHAAATSAMQADGMKGQAQVFVSRSGERCLAILDLDSDAASIRSQAVARDVEGRFQSMCSKRYFLYFEKRRIVHASLDGAPLPAERESILPYYSDAVPR